MFLDETRWNALADILQCAGFWSGAGRTQEVAEADIQRFSIEQLANVEITSVSETPHATPIGAAAIHVTSNDDAVADGNFPGKLVLIHGRGARFESRPRP